MKSSTKTLLTATALVIAITGPTVASAQGFGPGGKMCAQGEARHQKRMEERLTTLKNELKLTSGQEAGWQKFEQALRKQFADHDQARQRIQGSDDPMAARVEHMEQHVAGMKIVLQARDELYRTLTPEQKKIADRFFRETRGPRA